MKTRVKILLVEILILAIVYFSFAFVLTELNPFKWGQDARLFMTFSALFGMTGSIPIAETIFNKEGAK